MDLVAADIESLSASADANAFTFPPPAPSSSSTSDVDDIDNPNSSIASLMQISEKMDSLLPIELSNAHVPIYDPAIQIAFPTLIDTDHFTHHLPPTPAPSPLPVCSSAQVPIQALPSSSTIDPNSYYNVDPQNLHQNLLKNINYLVQMKHVQSPTLTATSITSSLPHHVEVNHNKTNSISPTHATLNSSPEAVMNTGAQPCPTLHSPYPTAPALSPCSIRDVSTTFTRNTQPSCTTPTTPERRARSKTSRKPKTYTKPVASRFCHICSRTPRRGHSAAVCSRMAQGLCRKIVCEQCFREQGWDFEATQQNPSLWRCPHCTDTCPARSQCHIYNRINARRKRNGGNNNEACGQPNTKRVKTSPSKSVAGAASIPVRKTAKAANVGMVGKPTKQDLKVERVLTMEHGAMWA